MKKPVSLALTEEIVKRLDRLAELQGLSRSRLVIRFIEEGLMEQEAVAVAFSNPVLVEAFAKAFGDRRTVKAMADAMSTGATDEQMELFSRTMEAVSGMLSKEKGRKPAKKKRGS